MIVINITTTTRQDTTLSALLVEINAQRTSQGLSTFATIDAWCKAVLVDQLRSWADAKEEKDAAAIETAYLTATNAVQSQVKSLLGVT